MAGISAGLIDHYRAHWERDIQVEKKAKVALRQAAEEFVTQVSERARQSLDGQKRQNFQLKDIVGAVRDVWELKHPGWDADVLIQDVFKVDALPPDGNLPPVDAFYVSKTKTVRGVESEYKAVDYLNSLPLKDIKEALKQTRAASTHANHFLARAVDAHVLQLISDADMQAMQQNKKRITVDILGNVGVRATSDTRVEANTHHKKQKAAAKKKKQAETADNDDDQDADADDDGHQADTGDDDDDGEGGAVPPPEPEFPAATGTKQVQHAISMLQAEMDKESMLMAAPPATAGGRKRKADGVGAAKKRAKHA